MRRLIPVVSGATLLAIAALAMVSRSDAETAMDIFIPRG